MDYGFYKIKNVTPMRISSLYEGLGLKLKTNGHFTPESLDILNSMRGWEDASLDARYWTKTLLLEHARRDITESCG